ADPGIGVVRHADAGYEKAREIAKKHGLRTPSLDNVVPARLPERR
ncbi:MAG: hypothetical protein HYT80_08180, partial [Euryarchaeota archaeon]|nr:hypothetical protein [Euryarchaeota archaeon]